MKNITNIVIIDDNKIDCFINQRIINLANKNINTIIFNSSSEALDYFKNNKEVFKVSMFNTNLILLDINMPKMNGFELLNKLALTEGFNKNSFLVFFLSSSNIESDILYAKENEYSSGYIVKPLTIDKINEALMPTNKTFKMII